jgi:hypothetical protein
MGKTAKFWKMKKRLCTGVHGLGYYLDRRNTLTNVRIVFYVTSAEKAALTKISKQTGAPASELMRRAFKQWLKGQKG